MKPSMLYLSFVFVVASTIAIELIFNKSLRRRAVEIEGKAEGLIHEGVEKTSQSLHEFTDNEFAWKVREEISNAFENVVHGIEKGAEIVEGALEHTTL